MATGTRSKFGAPKFVTGIFRKQMYYIEESTCEIFGTIRRPAVSRRPGNCVPLSPFVTPLQVSPPKRIALWSRTNGQRCHFRLLTPVATRGYLRSECCFGGKSIAAPRGVVLKKRYGNDVPTPNKKEDCTKWFE